MKSLTLCSALTLFLLCASAMAITCASDDDDDENASGIFGDDDNDVGNDDEDADDDTEIDDDSDDDLDDDVDDDLDDDLDDDDEVGPVECAYIIQDVYQACDNAVDGMYQGDAHIACLDGTGLDWECAWDCDKDFVGDCSSLLNCIGAC